MKYIAFIILLIPVGLCAQEIPKDANRIIVKNVSLDKVINTLLDNGYSISQKDTTYGTVDTSPRSEKKGTSRIFHIRIKENTAYITGELNLNMSIGGSVSKQNSTYEPIVYKGWRTGAYKLNFGYLDAFAKLLGNEISYERQGF